MFAFGKSLWISLGLASSINNACKQNIERSIAFLKRLINKGCVWLNVKYFPGIKYFQVKIFSRKENIFKCLVAFQKMLWKIFSSVWLYSENAIFLLVSHIFSTIFSASKKNS